MSAQIEQTPSLLPDEVATAPKIQADPSPGACWFCLCFPDGCPVSLAQICHCCAYRAPTLLPAEQPHPQDSFG